LRRPAATNCAIAAKERRQLLYAPTGMSTIAAHLSSSPRAPDAARDNCLLAALPEPERGRLTQHLEPVMLPASCVLNEAGGRVNHAYFPISGIVSLTCVLQNGAAVQTAVVGREGVVGAGVALGAESAGSRAFVHAPGYAYRVNAALLQSEFEQGRVLQKLLLRYIGAVAAQVAQTAACNRYHSIEQQLCRWLLLDLDRLATASLCVTQATISALLGVRREGVNSAAQRLQRDGLIHCDPRRITVLDRAGLEQRACECYAVVKHEYDWLVCGDAGQRGAWQPRRMSAPTIAAP
jgi:CRP-like cAMP-binding protein